MPEEPTWDGEPLRPQDSPAANRKRFKESSDDDIAGDSRIIDGSELGTAYHHVEEIGADAELKASRKFNRDDNEIDMTPMVDTTFLLLLVFHDYRRLQLAAVAAGADAASRNTEHECGAA